MVQKSIGIIGGKGFVGSNILPNINCDRNPSLKHYNVLINANGNSSKVLASQDTIADFQANVNSTLNVLLNFKFDTYIHISSCEVYEDISCENKTKEDVRIDSSKLSNYGFSKYLAELLVKKYCKKWIIIRLNGPIAENVKKGPIFDILHGDKLWISDKSEFQFIHMSSVSEFIKELIDQGVCNQIFNVTGENPVELKTVMRMLKKDIPSPESPLIRHQINIDKFSQYKYVTSSKDSIRRLISNLT
jgi:nucleoside-diphosphate-sugar epimerase